MVPQQIKTGGQPYFICPVCKHRMSGFSLKGLFTFLGILIIVWAVLFIHFHLTN
jgi:hypothetical protein